MIPPLYKKVEKLKKFLLMAFAWMLCLHGVMMSDVLAEDVEVLELKEHPRLWVPADTIYHLKDKLHTPYMKSSAARVIGDADWLVDAEPIAPEEGRTHQQGTRAIASHLQTLTAAYVLTRDQKYRDAAMRHLANILNWNHISCEANVNTPLEDKKFFCLSYGEHGADIALLYDVLRPDITESEMKVFNDVLDRFYLWQALRAYERNPWWVNKQWSNWNGVCAGGMGMLALAFYDDRPEVRKLIPFVDQSLMHYFQSYITNGGGNHEGTGYWNYGMHYAIRYLLSYENATGQKHPAFDIPELAKSLHFPVDFHRLTFGDNDGWHPSGMYFMMADRTNQPDAAMRAATYLMYEVPPAPKPEDRDRLQRTHTGGDILFAADSIPSDQAMSKLKAQREQNPKPLARVYENLEWAVLADDSAFAKMRMTVRGGSSQIRGHGHLDLLAFKCEVHGVRFIEDQPGGVMSVNYTGRGQDLYSRSAAAKSTLFVDGIACDENTEVTSTDIVEAPGIIGIRIDASNIYLRRWRGFIGRLFLQIDSRYWLVIDTAPGRGMESRFHTFAKLEKGQDWVRLSKQAQPSKHHQTPLSDQTEQLTMTFASLSPSQIQYGTGMPSTPRPQTTIIRWMNNSRSRDSLNVTALNPGPDALNLKLARDAEGFVINASGADIEDRTILLTSDLKLREAN